MTATTWYYRLREDDEVERLTIPDAEALLTGATKDSSVDSPTVVVGLVLIILARKPIAMERIGFQRAGPDGVETIDSSDLSAAAMSALAEEVATRFSVGRAAPGAFRRFVHEVQGFLPIEVADTMGESVRNVHRSFARLARTGRCHHPLWDLRSDRRIPALTPVRGSRRSVETSA